MDEPLISNSKDRYDVAEGILGRKIARDIRSGFIAKVYGILLYQLVIAGIMILLSLYSETYKSLTYSFSLLIVSFIVSILCITCPICFKDIYRKVPINYIIITIFAMSYGFCLSTITASSPPLNVLLSLGLTTLVVLGLTLYAVKTKRDFTMCGGLLVTISLCFTFSVIIAIFFPVTWLYVVINGISIVIFSIYLIYDTQLIIGKGSHGFSEDDYIDAAMNLYIDIISIFLDILSILNSRNN